MPNPDPNKDPQQSPPANPGGQQLPPDPEFSEELEKLARKLDAPEKDSPAVPSNLLTHEEVAFELELEGLRIKRERRLAFTWTRRSFVFLLGLMTLIVLVSTAVIVVGLSTGEKDIVLPALAPLSGAGATGALIWRAYISRLNLGADEERSA